MINQARFAQMATAARSDHLGEVTQAPNGPAPLPNLVHGRVVAAAAIAVPAIAAAAPHPIQDLGSGCSFPPVRSGVRHSGPSTCPRTGTAHARQSGRLHLAQKSTAGLPGWVWHLSVLTSRGTPESLDAGGRMTVRSDQAM